MIGYDEFWYETGMEDFCKWMLRDQLKKPMNLSEKKREYTPELKTNVREINNIAELMHGQALLKQMEELQND